MKKSIKVLVALFTIMTIFSCKKDPVPNCSTCEGPNTVDFEVCKDGELITI